jgi:hypothetical protein
VREDLGLGGSQSQNAPPWSVPHRFAHLRGRLAKVARTKTHVALLSMPCAPCHFCQRVRKNWQTWIAAPLPIGLDRPGHADRPGKLPTAGSLEGRARAVYTERRRHTNPPSQKSCTGTAALAYLLKKNRYPPHQVQVPTEISLMTMRTVLLTALLSALVIGSRVAYVVRNESYKNVEPHEMEQTAVTLVRKGYLGDPYLGASGKSAHVAPLYPVLLAGVYRIFGWDTSRGRLVQELLAILVTTIGILLTCKTSNGPRCVGWRTTPPRPPNSSCGALCFSGSPLRTCGRRPPRADF